MVTIGYLPPDEEQKLVNFDFKKVSLKGLMPKERVIELRSVIGERVFLHDTLGKYIRRLVAASRPYNADTEWLSRSPSALVEEFVDLGPWCVAARNYLLGTTGQGVGSHHAPAV